ACEGAILVLDPPQPIEAQTLPNLYLPLHNHFQLFPLLNKIHFPPPHPHTLNQQLQHLIPIHQQHLLLPTANSNIPIEQILDKILHVLPPP
ncbi:P-loop NTPase family protein, partial [Staphylococcus epidermidis]